MPTKLHRDEIESDIASLRSLIHATQGRDRLGEMSLRRRLTQLEQELRSIDAETRNVASVAIIFDGGPVRGSSAIDAEFAAKALQNYQELLTKHVVAAELGGLAQRGPLPNRHQELARMNIISVVQGSFGFLLEEDGNQAQLFETATQNAVTQVSNLLSVVSGADSRPFDEKIQDIDIRVFRTLKEFINLLYKANASLRLSEQRRDIKLDTFSITRARERVSVVEVEEFDERYNGVLLGIVPITRRFDFRRNDTNEVVQGKVAVNLSADYLERIEREELRVGGIWNATIRTKTVQRLDGRQASVSRTLIDLTRA